MPAINNQNNPFANSFMAMATSMINNTIITVNGLESAKHFQTKPNSTYALFDENEDIVYIVQTDSANYATYRTFQLNEIVEEPNTTNDNSYLVEEIKRLREEIEDVKQHIRKPKQNKQFSKSAKSYEQTNDDSRRDGTN